MSGHLAEAVDLVGLVVSGATLGATLRLVMLVRGWQLSQRVEYRGRVLALLDEMIAYARMHEQDHEAKGESERQFEAAAQGALVSSIRARVQRL